MSTLVVTLLSIIAAALVFSIGFWLGHQLREAKEVIKDMERRLSPPPPEPVRPAATIIDPDDLQQRAKFERDEMTRRLNAPEINE